MKINMTTKPEIKLTKGDFVLSTSGSLYYIVRRGMTYHLVSMNTGTLTPGHEDIDTLITKELQDVAGKFKCDEFELNYVGGGK